MSNAIATRFPDENPSARRGVDEFGNTVWFFFDKPIRVDESGDKPMFCLKDCLETNGITGKRPSASVRDQTGVSRFNTPGGIQNLVTITEQGFYVLTMRGHKPCSEVFRTWLAQVAVNIRKTRKHVEGPQSNVESPKAPINSLEAMLQQSQLITNMLGQWVVERQRVDRLESTVQSVENRVDQIEQRKATAERKIQSLPMPSVLAPSKTDADLTEQLVRFYCVQSGMEFRHAWQRLYEEVRRRCGFDATRRYHNNKEKYGSILDVIREQGHALMGEVYAIACEMFPLEPKINE